MILVSVEALAPGIGSAAVLGFLVGRWRSRQARAAEARELVRVLFLANASGRRYRA